MSDLDKDSESAVDVLMERQIAVPALDLLHICGDLAALMGKLMLMKELNAFDDFWRDDIQEMINVGEKHRDMVYTVFQVCDQIVSSTEVDNSTLH